VIGCEGAQSKVLIHSAYVSGAYWEFKLEINDDYTYTSSYWETDPYGNNFWAGGGLLESGFFSLHQEYRGAPPSTKGYIYIENLSNIPLRCKFSIFRKELGAGALNPYESDGSSPNTAFTQIDGDHLEFCLAPPVEEVEATSSVDFLEISGVWDFYINDFDNVVFTGVCGDFRTYLVTNMPDQFESSYAGGSFYIGNKDSQLHRFKFVPKNEPESINTHVPPDNPTFMEHDDGTLTFDLEPIG
jgi:hypothetical protein